MNKKLRRARIILISLLVLLILSWIGLGIYYFFFRDNEKVEYKDPQLTTTSAVVVELYNKISDVYLCETKLSFDPFSDTETADVIKVNKMNPELIPLLVFRQLELNGDFVYNNTNVVTITLSQFEEAALKLFKTVPDYSTDFAPTGEYLYQNLNFKFIDGQYIGTPIATGCEAEFPVKRSQLVGLEQNEDTLKLVVDNYAISYEQYTNNDLGNPENNIEAFIEENKETLVTSTYKYVFQKDKNDYYFVSVERESV